MKTKKTQTAIMRQGKVVYINDSQLDNLNDVQDDYQFSSQLMSLAASYDYFCMAHYIVRFLPLKYD